MMFSKESDELNIMQENKDRDMYMGKFVEVVSGNKIPTGIVGKVVDVHRRVKDKWYSSSRLSIKCADEFIRHVYVKDVNIVE